MTFHDILNKYVGPVDLFDKSLINAYIVYPLITTGILALPSDLDADWQQTQAQPIFKNPVYELLFPDKIKAAKLKKESEEKEQKEKDEMEKIAKEKLNKAREEKERKEKEQREKIAKENVDKEKKKMVKKEEK